MSPVAVVQRSLFILVAVVAVAGGLFVATHSDLWAQPPKAPGGKAGFVPPPPKVLVASARADVIAEPRTFVGTVKPIRRSLVGSAAPGRVEEYLINEGDTVKAGQPI